MKIWFFILTFLIACHSRKRTSIFNGLENSNDIEIYLTDYNLDSVPEDIETLVKAKRLHISMDSASGWTIYPPLSGLGEQTSPPQHFLPDQLTRLTNLESLALVNLDLVTLPEKFGTLTNLDTLILYMNKLTISKELGKILKLKKLKFLGLQGNIVTASDLKKIEDAIPGITLNPAVR